MTKELKVLELFAGTGNISAFFKAKGHKTLTIDNNPDLKPDIVADILALKVKDLPKEWRNPSIIWCSPPCQAFSVMTISTNWTIEGKPKTSKAYLGLALALKCLELIKELKPDYWFIENPRGMLRKQYFMRTLPRNTVTYCQYGATWMKPTDIWTNASEWIPKPKCSPGGDCHEEARRSEKGGIQRVSNWDGSGTIARGKIPDELCEEIVKICEGKLKTVQEVLTLKTQTRPF